MSPSVPAREESRMTFDDTPLITTVIPTYRRPNLLKRAISSVLRQRYPHLRVLVLDDCSNDETQAVVESLAREDHRVVYRQHSHNIGQTANWIYGMEQVETPFFSFLSDDDFLLPEFYATAMAHLTQSREAMFFCGATYWVNTKGQVLLVSTNGWREGIHRPPNGFFEMLNRAMSWNGIVFRRELTETVGMLHPVTSTDFDYLLRASMLHPYYVSYTPCAGFYMHNANTWWYMDVKQCYLDFLETASTVLKLMPAEWRPRAWLDLSRHNFQTLTNLYWAQIRDAAPNAAAETASALVSQSKGAPKAAALSVLARLSRFDIVRTALVKRLRRLATTPNTKQTPDDFVARYMMELETSPVPSRPASI